MTPNNDAVVLLSGGLDSSTCLAIAQNEGFKTYALSFDYGQRHKAELNAARQMATAAKVKQHIIAEINLRQFGGSALTSDSDVPKGRPIDEMGDAIPITYVPARNTVFLSFALAWAEVLGAHHIFIGVNSLDYSGYPDCRPEYIAAYQSMAQLATKAGVEGSPLTIHTPLIDLTKGQIIKRGMELGVDYSITNTCYDPSVEGKACGSCDACILRLKGFEETGLSDPAPYMQPL